MAIFVHKLRVATLSTAAALRFPVQVRRHESKEVSADLGGLGGFLTHFGSIISHIRHVIPRFLAHSNSDFQVCVFGKIGEMIPTFRRR